MSQNVFQIQGVVEVIADKAVRQLVVFRNTASQAAQQIQQRFSGLDRTLGSFSAFFTGLQFQRIAKGFLDASMKSEIFRAQMNLIIRDLGKVRELSDWIEDYEFRTPFDLPDLQKATIMFTKLTKVRGEDLSKVKDYVKLAGEMASIFDKPLDKAVEGLFKTFSGSALGLTILRNNFAITRAELEKFGVAFNPSGSIKNFQSQIGKVEFAIGKIINKLSGMRLAEERSETLAGKFEKLSSDTFRVSRQFGDALAPMMALVLDRALELTGAILSLDERTVNLIAVFFGFAGALGAAIVTFGPMIYFTSRLVQGLTALSAAAGVAGATGSLRALQVLLMPAGQGLGAVIAWLISPLRNFGGGLKAVTPALAGFVRWLGALVSLLGPGLGAAQANLTIVTSGLGGAFTSVAAAVTAAGAAFARFMTTTAGVRVGLAAVSGVVAEKLMELKELTDFLNKENKQKELELKFSDPEELAQLRKAAQTRTPKETTIFSDDKKESIKVPVEPVFYNKGTTSSQIGEIISRVQKAYDRMNEKTFEDQMRLQKRFDEMRTAEKGVLDPESKRTIRDKEAIAQAREAYELELAQYKASAQFSKEQIADKKKILEYLKEQRRITKEIEAFRGARKDLTPKEVEADLKEIKRKHQIEELTTRQAMDRLVALTRASETNKNQIIVGFEGVHAQLLKERYRLADQLSREQQEAIRAQMSAEEAEGRLTAERRLAFIVAQRDAIEKTAKFQQHWSKQMMADDAKLYEEEVKLRRQVFEVRRDAAIEITRFEKGEAAARLLELDKEIEERRLRGHREVDIKRWSENQKKLIEVARIREVQEIEDAIMQRREKRAEEIARTALDRANFELSRGRGSFEDVREANKGMDKAEDASAKRSMEAEIRDAQQQAAENVVLAQRLNETTKAIKERYAAEVAGRKEARRQRDEDLKQREEERLRQGTLNQTETQLQQRDAQLERLKEQQQAGANVGNLIAQRMRERYELAIAQVKAEAEAAKIGKDAIDRAKIEADARQKILQLTKDSTKEMAEQIKMQQEAERAKKSEFTFKGGTMTAEEIDALYKQRSEESRRRYENMLGGGSSRVLGSDKDMQAAAGKLGIPPELLNQILNPNAIKFEPIEILCDFNVKYPDGTVDKKRLQTSTERKNEDNKFSDTNQRGKPPK